MDKDVGCDQSSLVPAPKFYGLDKVSYGVRSDGIPVVLVEADHELALAAGLPATKVRSVVSTLPQINWRLVANLMLVVVDGPGIGFLLAAPAFACTKASAALSSRWVNAVDANGGAIALLVDETHLGSRMTSMTSTVSEASLGSRTASGDVLARLVIDP
jgi:hypothetical protein